MAPPVSKKMPHTPQPPRRTVVVDDDDDLDLSESARQKNELKGQIREALQQLANRLGRAPTELDVDAQCRYQFLTIRRYFGSLEAALVGLKISQTSLRPQEELQRVVAGQPSSDRRLRLPPGITSRPNFGEVVLMLAAGRGVQPHTILEEAMIFQWLGVGTEYFRRHPLHEDTVAAVLRGSGLSALARLPKINQLLLGERPPLAHPFLTYQTDQWGKVTTLGVVERPVTIPSGVADEIGFELLRGWLAARGVSVSGTVKEALIRHAVGAEWTGKTEFPIQSLEDMMAAPGVPIADLIAVAAVFDKDLVATPEVRLSFRAHGPRQIFAQLKLVPWQLGRELEKKSNVGEMVFRRDGQQWQLVQYQGIATEKLADIFFETRLPASDSGVVRDEDLVIRSKGHLRLTVAQLETVMATPRQRQLLMQTLWTRDHSGLPFPHRYAFRAVISEGKVTKVAMAQAMGVVPLLPKQVPEFPRDWAMLVFERDRLGVDQLRVFFGKGAQSLTLSVLKGNDIVLSHPLEHHVALRQLEPADRVSVISLPLTSDDILGFAGKHSMAAPQHLAAKAHAVNPNFPLAPDVVALSGLESHGKVTSVRLWHGDVDREALSEIYFWVQWMRDTSGNYAMTRVSRNFGKQMVQTMQAASTPERQYAQVAAISAEEARRNRAEVIRSPRPGHIIADTERAASAVLARYGVRVVHIIERAFLLRALGIDKMDRRISVTTAREFFSTQKDQALQRLLTILKPFDAQLAGDMTDGVRISFLQNTHFDAVSTFDLVRVTPELGWDENPDHSQLLFVPHEGRWPLNQYHGISGKEWADVVGILPHALVPPRHWVASKGQIMPPWGELRAALQAPLKRQWLYELLWRDKYPGRPLPEQRLLVASRNGESDATPTRALDFLDAIPFLNTDPPTHLARLFSVDDNGRDRLVGFDGRGGQDLTRAVLAGDGHLPAHPLEYALVIGHLCRKQFRHPLSLQDVTGYFSQYGHAGVERVVNAIAAVDPVFPKDANRFVIAAWIDGKLGGDNRLRGLKMIQEADFAAEFARNYTLWVEYEEGSGGQWRATPSEREHGRMVAAAGGRTLAPDADAKVRVATEVAKYAQAPEGFASIDPMSRPEPMITPAELKKAEPLVNVPVKIENKTRGFATDMIAWKDLALKPSDKRFVGELPKVGKFEALLIWAAALLTGVGLMRSAPMESFGSGGVFFHPSDSPSPNRI